jgi:lycopene beta-cyclase
MRPTCDADVVICGAGAAGLTLAVRLAERAPRLSVILVDARTGFEHDRTFSGFSTRPHPFASAIDRRYATVELADADGPVVRQTGAHPYTRIAGDLFYATALRKLGRAELRLGCAVLGIEPGPGDVRVETDRGSLRGRFVVDARGAFDGRCRIRQVFWGQVVRTERPVFDPDRAILMDFRVPQTGGAHFVYVLPTSRTEALVEDTWFTTGAVEEASHRSFVTAWLSERGAGAFEVLRTERGVLPMTADDPPKTGSPRVVRAGLAGGAAKGSTGYAFAFLSRHAEALAEALGRAGDAPPRWPALRTPVARFYDRVFLTFVERELSRDAAGVGRALVGLFRDAPLGSVARFLSEEAGPLDHARVMAAMPTVPFLQAAAGR